MELRDLLDFAARTAYEAGRLTLGYFRTGEAPVTVADARTLERAVIAFTDAASFEEHGREEAFRRLRAAAGASRGWSDAYGHALVATGRAELMLDPIMNHWDCAPFPPILREAGGYFGDWSGNETIYANEAPSTTTTLLPEVLRLVES